MASVWGGDCGRRVYWGGAPPPAQSCLVASPLGGCGICEATDEQSRLVIASYLCAAHFMDVKRFGCFICTSMLFCLKPPAPPRQQNNLNMYAYRIYCVLLNLSYNYKIIFIEAM